MFFGYTQCPDVCPTTLATLAEAMRRLGPDAAKVQVLFVTIDPERDTAELLSHYVTAFDPSFLGLCGDAEATARTAKEFKVLYQKQPGRTPGTYTMDHSAGTFIFDPARPAAAVRRARAGRRRVRARPARTAARGEIVRRQQSAIRHRRALPIQRSPPISADASALTSRRRSISSIL